MSLEMRPLGRTGLSVSRICFGSLTMAPLQGNYEIDRAAEVIDHHLGATGGQQQRMGAAETAAGTGDYGDFAIESHV